MVEDAIRTILLADGTVSGLVGTRIRPHAAHPSDDYPYIVYFRISTRHIESFDGSAGLAGARIQVQCWDETFSTVQTLSNAIRAVLQGYSGTVGGDVIQGISILDELDDFEPPVKKTERGVHASAIDALVWFEE